MNVIVDNTPPILSLNNIQGKTILADSNISISGNILEEIMIKEFEIQFDDSLVHLNTDSSFEWATARINQSQKFVLQIHGGE